MYNFFGTGKTDSEDKNTYTIHDIIYKHKFIFYQPNLLTSLTEEQYSYVSAIALYSIHINEWVFRKYLKNGIRRNLVGYTEGDKVDITNTHIGDVLYDGNMKLKDRCDLMLRFNQTMLHTLSKYGDDKFTSAKYEKEMDTEKKTCKIFRVET